MKSRKSFLLRMDPRLYADLEGWAEQEMRSVNGQIEFLLSQAVHRHKHSQPEGTQRSSQPAPAGSTESAATRTCDPAG